MKKIDGVLKTAPIVRYTQFSILSDHNRPFTVNNVPFPVIKSIVLKLARLYEVNGTSGQYDSFNVRYVQSVSSSDDI